MAARSAVLWYITATVIAAIIAVPTSGPYDVNISELKSCDDEGTSQMHFATRMGHVGGGKHVYNSNFVLGLPLDEDFVAKVDIQQWSSQGYRPRAFTHTAKGCKGIWPHIKTFLTSFTKSAGLNLAGCPIPQGNYTAKDWQVTFRFDTFAVLPYNKYKGVFDFYHKEVKVGCMIVFGEIVPQKKV